MSESKLESRASRTRRSAVLVFMVCKFFKFFKLNSRLNTVVMTLTMVRALSF